MKNGNFLKRIKEAKDALETLYRDKRNSCERKSELARQIEEKEDEIKEYEKGIEEINTKMDGLAVSLDCINESIKREERLVANDKKVRKNGCIVWGVLAGILAVLVVANFNTGRWLMGGLSGTAFVISVGIIIDVLKTAKRNIDNHQASIVKSNERLRICEQDKKDLSLELEKRIGADSRERLNEEISDLKPQLNLQNDFIYNIDENIDYYESLLTGFEQELMEMIESDCIDYSTLDEEDAMMVKELICAGLSRGHAFSKKID